MDIKKAILGKALQLAIEYFNSDCPTCPLEGEDEDLVRRVCGCPTDGTDCNKPQNECFMKYFIAKAELLRIT